jgi:GR25 family glycosyltransferase involved in LPS biosynthesis
MNIDKTFIVHYNKLKDRKDYIDNNILNKVGFENYEYIISSEDTDLKIIEKNNYVYNSLYNKLTNPEICNYETQFNIWERIVLENLNNCLIVEDDIIFKEDFNKTFNFLLSNIPKDYDICFFSECCDLYPIKPNKQPFVMENTSRCCVAYLINLSTCKKLIQVKNFHFPIDHHLNFVKNKLKLNYYWSDPTIFFQGSTIKYKSNAQRNR